MSDAIITVEGLGRRYRLGAGNSGERYTALRDVIAGAATAPFRVLRGKVGKWKSANSSGPASPLSNLPTFAFSMHVTAFSLWLGIWYLRRTEKTFADVI